jgi:hypothetical protein
VASTIDLESWARLSGTNRRNALDAARARGDEDGAAQLYAAVFDSSIDSFWKNFAIVLTGLVDKYNSAGRFRDLTYTGTADQLVIERRHEPRVRLIIAVDRDGGRIDVGVVKAGKARNYEIELEVDDRTNSIQTKLSRDGVIEELLGPCFED